MVLYRNTNIEPLTSRNLQSHKNFGIYEVKWNEVVQSCLNLWDPMDCSPPAPRSMGFSRHEYWSGLLFPSPGESSQPRDRTRVSRTIGRRFTVWATREAPIYIYIFHFSILARIIHGQRSLAGCSLWGHRESHNWACTYIYVRVYMYTYIFFCIQL